MIAMEPYWFWVTINSGNDFLCDHICILRDHMVPLGHNELMIAVWYINVNAKTVSYGMRE